MEKVRKTKKNPIINILTMTIDDKIHVCIIRIGKTVIKDWEIINNMLYLSPGGALLAVITPDGIKSRCNYILNIRHSGIVAKGLTIGL